MRFNLLLLAVANGHGVHTDYFDPDEIDSLQSMFKSTAEHPKEIHLSATNPIPNWINGNFYRDGPGIFEWGDSKYKHFFDPTGLLQRINFNNGQVSYNSQYIKGRNYKGNMEAQDIKYPEVGTWAEPNWVDQNSAGAEYSEVRKRVNRAQMIATNDAITDNTLVMAHPVHGNLLSMTETPFMNFHDPETLTLIGTADIREAKHFPSSQFQGTFQTAHGLIDANGDFWNIMGGLQVFMGVPYKTVYMPYKIPNAKSKQRLSIEEIMDSVEFGDFTGNLSPIDLDLHWFHQAMLTERFLVLPLTSISMNLTKVLKLIIGGEPLIKALKFYPDQAAEFRLFNKEKMTWEVDHVYTAPPMVNVHHINAFEAGNSIVFDTMLASNGDSVSMFEYNNLNSTGEHLQEQFMKLAPVGTAHRFVLDLTNPGKVEGQKMNFMNEENWEGYNKNGHEFPIINYWDKLGKPYDHFWSTGFGSFLPDRIYHTHISRGQRYVWHESGYSPSEPVFVSRPHATGEDDGVVLSLVSPLSDDTLTPFVVVLDGRTLVELSRLYLPDYVHVPVGFHSSWVPDEWDTPPVTHFQRPRHFKKQPRGL